MSDTHIPEQIFSQFEEEEFKSKFDFKKRFTTKVI